MNGDLPAHHKLVLMETRQGSAYRFHQCTTPEIWMNQLDNIAIIIN